MRDVKSEDDYYQCVRLRIPLSKDSILLFAMDDRVEQITPGTQLREFIATDFQLTVLIVPFNSNISLVSRIIVNSDCDNLTLHLNET